MNVNCNGNFIGTHVDYISSYYIHFFSKMDCLSDTIVINITTNNINSYWPKKGQLKKIEKRFKKS